MNSVLITRILLILLALIFLSTFLKFQKMFRLERRIAKYSISNIKTEDLSLLDKIDEKYNTFLSKFQNNKPIKNYLTNHERKIPPENHQNPLKYLFNKLLFSITTVLLVIISNTIQGKSTNFLIFLLSLVIGYYIYDIYLIIKRKNEKKNIKEELLRAVIIMNNAFKVGKTTIQAVEIASHDLPKPICYEFMKIYQDMSYGLSVDVAFNRFAKRVNLEEARYIASSLTILNKTGGNIVMVFSSIERTLFDKKKLESDLKNSTAASNLVVKVLIGIPIIFTGIIYIMSPTYFEPFFSSPLGLILLGIIIIMFAIYIYLLKKIMKVRV